MDSYLIILSVIAGGAFLWPWVARKNSVLAGWLSALAPITLCGWLFTQQGVIADGQYPESSWQWVSYLDIAFTVRLDGVGLLLAILVSGIGSLILIYGGAYLRNSPQAAPFFACVQLFMLAMLGLAVADDLILLFVFWELTSIASYLLIGLSHQQLEARKAALRALLVTGGGGLALLAGILLLGSVGGSYSLEVLQNSGGVVRNSEWYVLIFGLVALGAMTKSAQVPFHFWLPDAMSAPTPVSAYLHSATMVKAGVFLLAKLFPVLGGTALWENTLLLFGATTMVWGGLLALAQTDLKRLLAYSTLSMLGTLVMLLGVGTEAAVKAAMLLLLVHALYKAPLFMVAGILDKATGTRDVTHLRALGKKFPLLAIIAIAGAFSMSGIPPLIGFIGKELLYEAELAASGDAWWLLAAGILANVINVVVAFKVGFSPFFGRGECTEIKPLKNRFSLFVGPALLVSIGVLWGLLPQGVVSGIVNSATADVMQVPATIHLKLWHGFNLILLLSAVTLVVGCLLYLYSTTIRKAVNTLLSRFPLRASETFDCIWNRMLCGAGRVTRIVQHGNLRLYLIMMVCCLGGLVAVALMSDVSWKIPQSGTLRFVPTVVVLLMMFGAFTAIRAQSMVMAVLAMGSVGYGVALLFALFGAPDLALTQVLVETLTLILFVLVIKQMPALHRYSSLRRRSTDLAIAILGGVLLIVVLLVIRMDPAPDGVRVSADMVQKSVVEAHGRNVVNVILVDFRAFDTLGEICVLTLAALGVAGLLLGDGKRDLQAERSIATPLFQTAVKWISPLLLLLALILLFRGHNEPGGGFIGGLIAAAALILRRLAGARSLPSRVARFPFIWIGAGLLSALMSALPALLVGDPFMTGEWGGAIWVPFVGHAKLGTPFWFDVGVFMVVVGTTLLMLSRLMRRETSYEGASNPHVDQEGSGL